jgi:hypothetical protein
MNSGYKIISLKRHNFENGETYKINGVYDRIENGHNKPILLRDLIFDGIERISRFVTYSVIDSDFVINLTDFNAVLTINSDDVCVIRLNETKKNRK